ncbi:DUF1090 family protein [Proteus mirabilis]|uniref:DUF1090 family protein n=1 Tax=Proteus mirabilis TaxID=584 RepID=UPI0039B4FB27
MKIKILVTSLLLLFLPLFSFAGSKGYGCDKRIYNLENQLKYAQKYGNVYREQALKRAISNIKSNCYDHYSGATGPTKLHDHSSRERLFGLELNEWKKIIDELKDLD